MNKKIVTATILFIAFIAFTGGIYAAFYVIRSNIVTITIEEYELVLNANATLGRVGETILFYGNLTKDGSGVEGETVKLYFSNNTWTGGQDVTFVDGSYSIVWVATEKGTFNFYAEVELD